jgi:hypothetical protein
MIEYDDDQFNNICQIFRMLNIYEECKKIAPFNMRFILRDEYAPYDLELEEECSFGINCVFKNTPLICYKNHQGIKSIKKYTMIPRLLCKYERPWRYIRLDNNNYKKIKCNNVNCWFSHLKGRKEHLQKIWIELNELDVCN